MDPSLMQPSSSASSGINVPILSGAIAGGIGLVLLIAFGITLSALRRQRRGRGPDIRTPYRKTWLTSLLLCGMDEGHEEDEEEYASDGGEDVEIGLRRLNSSRSEMSQTRSLSSFEPTYFPGTVAPPPYSRSSPNERGFGRRSEATVPSSFGMDLLPTFGEAVASPHPPLLSNLRQHAPGTDLYAGDRPSGQSRTRVGEGGEDAVTGAWITHP